MLVNLWISFIAGLLAPLGAVCVLPLYPGFLAYLANQISVDEKEKKKKIISFGLLIGVGIILSMFVFGLIFTLFLQESLTKAIGIVSPIAFGILALISLLLIFNFDFTRFMPKITNPRFKNPYLNSLAFGLFFGAIVLPCNPAPLAVLFAVSTSITSFLTNLLNFFFFGVGMALPLIVLAIVSAQKSKEVLSFLAWHKKKINFVAGMLMLIIALYYLIFVFQVFG